MIPQIEIQATQVEHAGAPGKIGVDASHDYCVIVYLHRQMQKLERNPIILYRPDNRRI